MQPHPDVSSRPGGDDALFAVQLEIARKADELARSRGIGPGLNLYCWLLAEAEILGPIGVSSARAVRTAAPVAAVPV